MKNAMVGRLALISMACLIGVGTTLAAPGRTGCDVVLLNGTGTRINDQLIVGSETLTVVATGETIPVEFTSVALGVTAFADGQVTFISSHDFKGVNDKKVSFTTFDEVRTVPLAGDPSCTTGACGLVFKLVLEKGVGKYTCGQIVSGYDPTLASFTSTLKGYTLELNSVGKLCDCSLSGNN